MACAHDFILNLPDGYDTYFSGSSVQLSGGQMQRIAIARALIRNPKILVLDEATSALDQLSEEHVSEALTNIRTKKKVTTVTIAHRLTTIMDSDAIAVIANGKIAEMGDHETLLQKEDGIYRLLCQSQGIKPSAPGSVVPHLKNPYTASAPMSSDQQSKETAKESIFEVTEEGLAASKTENEMEPSEVEIASMSSIWHYAGWDAIYTLMGVTGSAIVGALSPCESILTAKIVTTFYSTDPDEMVAENLTHITKFMYFALASLVGNCMIGYGLANSGSNLGAKLRSLSFGSMLKHSMGWFDLPEHSTGDLTNILGAEVESVEALVGLPLGFRVRVLTSVITGVAIALAYALQIGLVAIACVPFIMMAGMVQVCCSRKKMAEASNGPSPPTIMEQALRGIASVQAYNLEIKVGDEYEKALEPESSGKVKSGMIAGAVFGFSQMAGEWQMTLSFPTRSDLTLMFGSLRYLVFVSFAIVFAVGSKLMVDAKIGFEPFFTSVLAVMFGALGASQGALLFSSLTRKYQEILIRITHIPKHSFSRLQY
jgi:ABC-type multidrug transport system fused ATPase/permease subunit